MSIYGFNNVKLIDGLYDTVGVDLAFYSDPYIGDLLGSIDKSNFAASLPLSTTTEPQNPILLSSKP